MIECLFLGSVLLVLSAICAWLERRDRQRNGPEPGAVRRKRTIFVLRAIMLSLAVPCAALAQGPTLVRTVTLEWDRPTTNCVGETIGPGESLVYTIYRSLDLLAWVSVATVTQEQSAVVAVLPGTNTYTATARYVEAAVESDPSNAVARPGVWPGFFSLRIVEQ